MPILGLFPTAEENRYRRKIVSMSEGRGPSLARQQMLEGLRQTNANLLAAAGSHRGASSALGMRNALAAGADAAANVNAEAARQKQQEMLWALGERDRLERERVAGINNAFGALARIGAAAATGGMSEMGGAGNAIQGTFSGSGVGHGRQALAAPATRESALGMVDRLFGPPGSADYRSLLQAGPASAGQSTLLSDEREKDEIRSGRARTRRMLEDMQRLRQSRQLQQELASADGTSQDPIDRLIANVRNPEFQQGLVRDANEIVSQATGANPVDALIAEARSGRLARNLESGIRDVMTRNNLREMFRRARPIEFRYRNPDRQGASPGTRVGVSAQDLRNTELGRQITRTTPDGRVAVDIPGAMSAVLAGQADQQRRLDTLENAIAHGAILLDNDKTARDIGPRQRIRMGDLRFTRLDGRPYVYYADDRTGRWYIVPFERFEEFPTGYFNLVDFENDKPPMSFNIQAGDDRLPWLYGSPQAVRRTPVSTERNYSAPDEVMSVPRPVVENRDPVAENMANVRRLIELRSRNRPNIPMSFDRRTMRATVR